MKKYTRLSTDQRDNILGEIREAQKQSIGLLDKAGADAVVIFSLKIREENPNLPAGTLQIAKKDGCDLEAVDILDALMLAIESGFSSLEEESHGSA